MASITTWTRLEPGTRNEDLRVGLQARVHDPLWLLARQWQLGEFQGEDAGSAIAARWQADCSQLTRFHAGRINDGVARDAQNYDSRVVPLEAMVEREDNRVRKNLDIRVAAEAGLHFLRLLAERGLAAYRTAYLAHYALQPPDEGEGRTLDNDSLQYWRIMAHRTLDGHRLFADLRTALRPSSTGATPPALPAQPEIKEAERAKVMEVANTWLKWYEPQFGAPADSASSWVSDRMEYEFAVAAQTTTEEVVLTAREYMDGDLDWYSFNVTRGPSLSADRKGEKVTRVAIPSPVSYPGMPSSRWWEFEDARIDFGAVPADCEDLAKMLMLEFALTYGNDWFIVPMDVKVGSICRISSLVVTDSFGERTLIRPAGEVDGETVATTLFTLSPDRSSDASRKHLPALFLPPVLASRLESKPIEEVLLLRDEMANMAWGVERAVESRIGERLNRTEARPPEPPAETSASAPLIYRLMISPPDYWYPLLPLPLTADSIQFKLAALPVTANAKRQVNSPQGAILSVASGERLTVREEEIPRAGARVTRAYQYARWIDGSTHLWIGRRKRAGRGEGASNLQFDVVW